MFLYFNRLAQQMFKLNLSWVVRKPICFNPAINLHPRLTLIGLQTSRLRAPILGCCETLSLKSRYFKSKNVQSNASQLLKWFFGPETFPVFLLPEIMGFSVYFGQTASTNNFRTMRRISTQILKDEHVVQISQSQNRFL